MTKEKIIKNFYSTSIYDYDEKNNKWVTTFDIQNYKRPVKLAFDLIDAKNNKKVLSKGEKLNFIIAKKLEEKNLKEIFVTNEELIGKYTSKDLVDKKIIFFFHQVQI